MARTNHFEHPARNTQKKKTYRTFRMIYFMCVPFFVFTSNNFGGGPPNNVKDLGNLG